MARVVRLNSLSGGAVSTASLSLEDVEAAFSLQRHIETISVVSGAGKSAIEFKNLDTKTYGHFKILGARVKLSANNDYMWFGGMVGDTRTTAQSWTTQGVYGSQEFTSNRTSEMRTSDGNNMMTDLDDSSSYGTIEWNIYFPHPDQDSTSSKTFQGNFYKGLANYGMPSQTGYSHFVATPNAAQDGFYFRPNSGTFEQGEGMDSLFSIYGTKRRAAAA